MFWLEFMKVTRCFTKDFHKLRTPLPWKSSLYKIPNCCNHSFWCQFNIYFSIAIVTFSVFFFFFFFWNHVSCHSWQKVFIASSSIGGSFELTYSDRFLEVRTKVIYRWNGLRKCLKVKSLFMENWLIIQNCCW